MLPAPFERSSARSGRTRSDFCGPTSQHPPPIGPETSLQHTVARGHREAFEGIYAYRDITQCTGYARDAVRKPPWMNNIRRYRVEGGGRLRAFWLSDAPVRRPRKRVPPFFVADPTAV